MHRNLLVPGEKYAYSSSKYKIPEPITIVSLRHEFPTMKYGREIGKHWGVSGRIGESEDVVEINARWIMHPWEIQERLNAFERSEEAEKARRAEDRTKVQQREIAHMLALAPKDAWEGLVFTPGQTPHLTVKALTRIIKAARTAALAEATEPTKDSRK